MRRSRFSEEQIIALLQERGRVYADDAKTSEVCRRHVISGATFYAWKAKFCRMQVYDSKKPKALEEESTKLKDLYADAMVDNAVMKDLLGRKW